MKLMKILFVGKNEFTCIYNWFCWQQQLCLYQEYAMLKNGRLISVVFFLSFPLHLLFIILKEIRIMFNYFIILQREE